MFGSINTENERIRAQRVLRSLTDYQEAVELFAPARSQDEQTCVQVETAQPKVNAKRDHGQSVMRIFKALKLNPATKRA